jgi:hypothetical protein
MNEGVEVVRSPSAGGLSIFTHKQENETVPSIEEDAFGQEATLVECNSLTSKTRLGSIYKSLRRRKVKQAPSIILPPQLSAQLNLKLAVDERRQEANQKAHYARQLLEAAFVENQHDVSSQEFPAEFKGMSRIDMIETAFKYAVEARRLVSSNKNYAALNDALEDHRAQGEAAALEARHFILACKSRANLEEEEQNDVPVNGGLYTPQDIQDAAETHRTRAMFHMEYILSTFDDKIKAPEHIILNRSPQRNGEDATLSTLGFDNTFQDSPTSKEKYSISSLNEIMDGPQSLVMSKQKQQRPRHPLVDTSANNEMQESQPVSPLSGTVESQLRPEIEQVRQEPDTARPPTISEPKRPRLTPGSLFKSSLSKRLLKKKKNHKRQNDDDGSDDVSSMSELASIRAMEEDFNTKLKKAQFSLMGSEDQEKRNAPKFVRAPSLDLSIMSLENWDKVADGNSIDEIVKQAEAEKERKIRQEHDASPVVVISEEPKQTSWTARLWAKSQSENLQVKAPTTDSAADINTNGPSALELQQARLTGKKPDVVPPPFVIVSGEDRVQSTLDDIAPQYQVQSMNIFGVDAAPANEDAMTKSTRGKKWKNMLSWKKADPSKIIGAAKLGRKKLRDVDTEEGVYHHDGAPKGVTTSTDTDACSWPEARLRSSEERATSGDTYRSLAKDVDDAIERAEKQKQDRDPLDYGIDILLNNANPDIVRKVLSADAAKADDSDGKPIDFADVEYENEDAVRTQSALLSRDAVLQNIYADRTQEKPAEPLKRAATFTNSIAPSSSFMNMIDQEKQKNEESRKPKRRASFFHRRNGKESVIL